MVHKREHEEITDRIGEIRAKAEADRVKQGLTPRLTDPEGIDKLIALVLTAPAGLS